MGPRSALFVMMTGLAPAACSSTGQIEQELSRIRQEVRALKSQITEESQAREALESRVSLLTSGRSRGAESSDVRASTSRASQQRRRDAAGEPALPELPVVKLPGEVKDHDGLGAVDDGGAPVMIRLGPSGGADRLSVDHTVLAKPDPVLGTSGSKSESRARESMNEHYARALSKLRQENDPKGARSMLRDFLDRYPQSHLNSNVSFWLAECSFVEKNYERAAREFEGLLSAHPRSAKVPDALLRLALSFKNLGKAGEAEVVAKRLVSEHPESEAARQVPDQIGSLRG